MYKDFKSKQAKHDSLNELESVSDVHALNNSIKNILTTRRGSVPGIPEFGSDLYLVVFSHLDSITEKMAIRYTREALSRHEDRIIVLDVRITKDDAFNKMIINIVYRYRDNIGRTQTESTFVSFGL